MKFEMVDGDGVGEGDSGKGKSEQENANVVMAGVAGDSGEEEPKERTYGCPKCGKGMKCIAFSFRGSWADIMQGKYRPHWEIWAALAPPRPANSDV